MSIYFESTKLYFKFRRQKECPQHLMLPEYKDKIISLPRSCSGGYTSLAGNTLAHSPVLRVQLQPPSKAIHSSILTPT